MKRNLLSLVAICLAMLVVPCFALADAPGAEFDVRPEPVKSPPPAYPEKLKGMDVAGVVAVKMQIDESGNVVQATALKSNHAAFEPPAVEAVLKWKFKPATKDGKAVVATIVLPVRFPAE
jgi:protein TonB